MSPRRFFRSLTRTLFFVAAVLLWLLAIRYELWTIGGSERHRIESAGIAAGALALLHLWTQRVLDDRGAAVPSSPSCEGVIVRASLLALGLASVWVDGHFHPRPALRIIGEAT